MEQSDVLQPGQTQAGESRAEDATKVGLELENDQEQDFSWRVLVKMESDKSEPTVVQDEEEGKGTASAESPPSPNPSQEQICEQCFGLQKKRLKELDDILVRSERCSQLFRDKRNEVRFSEARRRELAEEEALLRRELEELDSIEGGLRQDVERLRGQVLEMERKEGEYFREMDKLESKLFGLFEKGSRLEREERRVEREVERLRGFSLLNELFRIDTRENAGRINGLALGRANSTEEMRWDEIYAGLGQFLLLLNYLFLAYGYPLRFCSALNCRGSTSGLLRDDKQLPLFGDIDRDLTAFSCALELLLREFDSFVGHLRTAHGFAGRLEFAIDREQATVKEEHVGLHHYQHSRTRWESWTTAMRYFLLNVKGILLEEALLHS